MYMYIVNMRDGEWGNEIVIKDEDKYHKKDNWGVENAGIEVAETYNIISVRLINQTYDRSSDLTELDTRGYDTLKRPQADVRLVNQSPMASLFTNGTKCCSRSWGVCRAATCLRLSTALSLTTVSSTVARLSSGCFEDTISIPIPHGTQIFNIQTGVKLSQISV